MTIWQPSYGNDDIEILEQHKKLDAYFEIFALSLKFKLFSGGWSDTFQRHLIQKNHAAAVLLYHPEQDQVVLIEQMRFATLNTMPSPWLLEIVCGTIELHDTPEATVHREAQEEAGCKILDLIPMCGYLSSCGVMNEHTYIYCGRINACVTGSLHGLGHEAEDIKVHVFTLAECLELLKHGVIQAASTVIALQWMALNQSVVKKKWLD